MKTIDYENAILDKLNSITTVLKVKKSTDSSFTILAGKYNPGILGVEIMTVNAIPGSGYNFFERDQLATAIHETSHAGGADDYYDSNNNVDPRWDNAYIIENIANGGIRGVLHSLQMPLECKCE